MVAPAYEREPYRTELQTTVLSVGEEKGRPFAVLEDTILYPEGGGQPPDQGSLEGVRVVDVQKRGGEARHYLEKAVATGPARLLLDWARRFDHMQQHTGQHLLSAVAEDRFGWATTAFHLGPSLCDVELATPLPARAQLDALEEAVASEVRAGRQVRPRRVSAEEYGALQVRTRGLPEGHEGDVRLVEIEGVDRNTCGGTHLSSTAEIETLKLLGTEALRGGTRLFFVAGGRVRRRLAEHEERAAALRGLLGAGDAELVAAARQKLEQKDAADRKARALEEELSEVLVGLICSSFTAPHGAEGIASAKSPATRSADVLEADLAGKAIPFLQKVARALSARAPGSVAFLTGEGCFAVAVGEALPLDAQALGREVATLLGGRGGGSGRVFQGKVPSLAARADALALISLRSSAPA